MNERELLITAYHEGGHALVAAAMPGNDPVQKVTILPRGRALGYTMVMPDADKYSQTRGELLDQLAYIMGGRAAEELVFHDPTTGASNDIEKATNVARAMVTKFGMTSVSYTHLDVYKRQVYPSRDRGSPCVADGASRPSRALPAATRRGVVGPARSGQGRNSDRGSR